jgi:hypothetical protein
MIETFAQLSVNAMTFTVEGKFEGLNYEISGAKLLWMVGNLMENGTSKQTSTEN